MESGVVEGGVVEGGVVKGGVVEGGVTEVDVDVVCGTGFSLSGSLSVASSSSSSLGGLRRGTEGMIIFPGPQGLTSKQCGIDLFKGSRFQLGFRELDEEDEGPETVGFTAVEFEAEGADELEGELEGPALLLSSSGSSFTHATFID